MKTLIIAEKPDMGRNIAAAIDPKAKNQRTYIEGEQYIITWAIGHLIGLAEPDAYDDRYKKWNLGDLPIIPEQFKLVPNAKTKDQLKVIAELAKRCSHLVNACDAGREGQHIFSLIQRHLKLKQPVKRLWISDLTPETIRRGFAELKEGADFEPLTRAAKARSEADWLIGMNGSRAFTTKHKELLSVGRVQTPVLALLYDRQKEIEAFQSNKYYEVEAWFEQGETLYRGLWQGERLTDGEKAKALAEKVKGKRGRVESYEVKDTKEYPFKLYDLTLLQREANAKFGFSAKKTLDLAQTLYEKHKAISYPRTNSNYVTEQNIPEMHRALDQLAKTDYRGLVEGADKKFVHKNNKAVCNPSKVEDHHAILPTHKTPGALPPDEAKLYDLIVRRFLSQFYPAASYKMHTVLTAAEGERFKSTIKQLLDLGWKVIYADQKKEKPTGRGKGKADGKEDDEESAEEEVQTPFTLDSRAAEPPGDPRAEDPPGHAGADEHELVAALVAGKRTVGGGQSAVIVERHGQRYADAVAAQLFGGSRCSAPDESDLVAAEQPVDHAALIELVIDERIDYDRRPPARTLHEEGDILHGALIMGESDDIRGADGLHELHAQLLRRRKRDAEEVGDVIERLDIAPGEQLGHDIPKPDDRDGLVTVDRPPDGLVYPYRTGCFAAKMLLDGPNPLPAA
ncbi:putative DNA topoisomerase III [Paenibacillus mucilaginosus 3016]|uniref:DNA topoisomerase n=1 Tax=Paenibacillus mucilaginosus 3016 TaxID=1116391 RepID=H6NHR0_9BACL|nr:DNA topoisomerase [Paenibacillus mucilaginosus]AFC30131.1 putative DNA topoisomerase III [Paenibacillus mucilaginosus 3016]